LNTQRKIIIFIGPPGSGKGSLSHLCKEHFNWVQLSTGNLCRKHIAERTEIGTQIDNAIKEGKLISDSLIISMVDGWLTTQRAEYVILDGYPRTVTQARALRKLMSDKFNEVGLSIVKLAISDKQVIARLTERSVCQNQDCQAVYSTREGSSLAPKHKMTCNKCDGLLVKRADDRIEVIQERLKTYYTYEKDLVNYYMSADIEVKKLEVEKPLVEVFSELQALIGMHYS
jgi:adenylate kinase